MVWQADCLDREGFGVCVPQARWGNEMLINGTSVLPAAGSGLDWQSELSREGFTVVRGVLAPDQVTRLRNAVRIHLRSAGWFNYGGKFQVQAMHAVPEVGKILASDAVLDVLQQVTHPHDVVLTGECDIMMNTTSTWHKDITHHPLFRDGRVFTDEAFRIYKIAFYLQDQDDRSRATLKVRPKSHRLEHGEDMPVQPASVRAGDAVIFDVRIDHVGQFPSVSDKLLRRGLEGLGPRLHVDPQKAFSRLRTLLRWAHPGSGDRIAAFMTFGPAHDWTRAYAEAGGRRHAPVAAAMSSEVSASVSGTSPGCSGSISMTALRSNACSSSSMKCSSCTGRSWAML